MISSKNNSSSHYDEALKEIKEKGERLANQYIVELYVILRDEEKLQPQDCRAKIEHDCIDLWSKATIRKYLPSEAKEAKDSKKQKAGKIGAENKNENAMELLVTQNEDGRDGARTDLAGIDSVSQKERNSAVFSAATAPEEAKKIVVDTQGRPIEEEENLVSTYDSSITNTGDIVASPQEGSNNQIKPDLECPGCQQLYAEVIELSETVKKLTVLKTADDILASSTSPINENQLEQSVLNFLCRLEMYATIFLQRIQGWVMVERSGLVAKLIKKLEESFRQKLER